jgi:hypothetical protein
VVTRLIQEDRADFRVLETHDKWYGITYQADRPLLVSALEEKTQAGIYPTPLWR